MASDIEAYRKLVTEFEAELSNRREKNDQKLDALETAELRGEIKLLKTFLQQFKERARIAKEWEQ